MISKKFQYHKMQNQYLPKLQITKTQEILAQDCQRIQCILSYINCLKSNKHTCKDNGSDM